MQFHIQQYLFPITENPTARDPVTVPRIQRSTAEYDYIINLLDKRGRPNEQIPVQYKQFHVTKKYDHKYLLRLE